jgi:homoserine O-succinyltransferase/O-acetyltransferase
MPVEVEPRNARTPPSGAAGRGTLAGPIRIGLVNNMPDTALHSTETQFRGLLQAAAGAEPLTLRLSSFPELPRGPEGQEHVRSYWPLDELLAGPLDALIVTGTEPRAPLLTDEPYWHRFGKLFEYAERHTFASVWSCLAAHAIVEHLHGIRRQRLAEKRCGVYEHSILGGDALLAGVAAPMPIPHSRWNELPVDALRAAGYRVLSWSAHTGADAFARDGQSLLLFFQGHPEYEDTTLLKEYRRDVGRYLNAQQAHYPTLPHGYLTPEARSELEKFRARALAERSPALLEHFPFAAIAATVRNTWRPAAVSMYRNWLSFIGARRKAEGTAETVSWADL